MIIKINSIKSFNNVIIINYSLVLCLSIKVMFIILYYWSIVFYIYYLMLWFFFLVSCWDRGRGL